MKDHNYGLPIKNIVFHRPQSLVLSCDLRIVKIWDEHTVRVDIWNSLTLFVIQLLF